MDSISRLIELTKELVEYYVQEDIYYTKESGKEMNRIISNAESDYRRWLSDTNK